MVPMAFAAFKFVLSNPPTLLVLRVSVLGKESNMGKPFALRELKLDQANPVC